MGRIDVQETRGTFTVMFIAVFIVAFMTSDYLITGSVTETWMGIAVIAGILTGVLRRMISGIVGAVTS